MRLVTFMVGVPGCLQLLLTVGLAGKFLVPYNCYGLVSLVVESGSLVVESVSLTVAPRCYWWVRLSPETLQSSAWVLGLGLAGMFLVPVPYCRWLCIVVGGCPWLVEV